MLYAVFASIPADCSVPLYTSAVFLTTGLVTGKPLIIIERNISSLPAAFVAFTLKSNSPAATGVPEIKPVFSSSVKPAGKIPKETDHLIGSSPVAPSITE